MDFSLVDVRFCWTPTSNLEISRMTPRRAHLGFNIRQFARLLGRLAEEIGSHLQHGRRLGVYRTSLHFLHPRAYILLNDVFQLPEKNQQTVRISSRIVSPWFYSGNNHKLRRLMQFDSRKSKVFPSYCGSWTGAILFPLGPRYPTIHLQVYFRQIPTHIYMRLWSV